MLTKHGQAQVIVNTVENRFTKANVFFSTPAKEVVEKNNISNQHTDSTGGAGTLSGQLHLATMVKNIHFWSLFWDLLF